MLALIQRNRVLRRIVLYQLLGGLQMGTFSLLFNLYLLALGHREDLIGIVSGVMTLALSFAALSADRLVRRWGARAVMAGGLLLSSTAAFAQALSTQAAPIVFFAVLIGCGAAMMQTLQMPLIAERVAPEDRANAAAMMAAVASLAMTGGTLLGGVLPGLLGRAGLDPIAQNRGALLLAISVGALGVIPILRLDRPGGAATPQFSASLGGAPTEELPSRIRRLIWRYAAATGLISIGAGAFLPFVNVYLARLGADAGTIGGLLAMTGALGAVLGLSGPTLSRRIGRERFAVTMRVLPVVPAFLLLAHPTIVLVVLTHATRQIGAGMTWPIEASILNERVPARARARAFGLRIAAWNLAWAVTSTISGQLIVRGGYNYPLLILIASTVLGGITLSLVLRPTPDDLSQRGATTRANTTPATPNQHQLP